MAWQLDAEHTLMVSNTSCSIGVTADDDEEAVVESGTGKGEWETEANDLWACVHLVGLTLASGTDGRLSAALGGRRRRLDRVMIDATVLYIRREMT